VLNPGGVLHLTGSNLFFEEDDPDCACVLEGTRSGKTMQSVFASISNSEILLVPDILLLTHDTKACHYNVVQYCRMPKYMA
jgi:hypothetical protein